MGSVNQWSGFNCETCGKVFNSKHAVKMHCTFSHFICEYCNNFATTKSGEFELHLKKWHPRTESSSKIQAGSTRKLPKPIRNSEINSSNASQRTRRPGKVKKLTTSEDYVCEKCNYSSTKFLEFHAHCKNYSHVNTSKKYLTWLSVYLKVVPKPVPTKKRVQTGNNWCGICTRWFSTIQAYNLHKEFPHFSCEHCNYSTTIRHKFDLHVARNHKDRTLPQQTAVVLEDPEFVPVPIEVDWANELMLEADIEEDPLSLEIPKVEATDPDPPVTEVFLLEDLKVEAVLLGTDNGKWENGGEIQFPASEGIGGIIGT